MSFTTLHKFFSCFTCLLLQVTEIACCTDDIQISSQQLWPIYFKKYFSQKSRQKIFKTYWMDTFNVSVEFSASFKKLFTVLAPIFFLLYFIDREVKASMILCSLDWRKSLLANGTLFALRMTLVYMDGNLAETRYGSGTQLAKTLDSSFLMNRKNLLKTIWINEWLCLLWID